MNGIKQIISRHKRRDAIFAVVGLLSLMIGLVTLLALIVDLAIDGLPRLSWNFLISYPSRFPDQAGILAAWVGTTLGMLVAALTTVPLGNAARVFPF